MRSTLASAVAVLAAVPLLGACSDSPAYGGESPRLLRFTGIPDSDKAKLTRQFEVVAEYLSAELDIEVEYVHVPDYTGAVTALAANKVDLVWLGGVTSAQAEERTDGEVAFVATRETDLRFKSYFIANRAHVESGRFQEATSREPMELSALAALKDGLAQSTFTFGSKSSTSGHIMPRHFLESSEVGIDPESDFQGSPGFQIQGGHSATLQQVATGAFDVGVLNYTNWEKADAETQAAAPVIYVTPEYVDYCMVAHARLGEEMIGELRAAFEGLDPADEGDAAVLDAFSATRFVAADPKDWDGIRKVLESARERGVLD